MAKRKKAEEELPVEDARGAMDADVPDDGLDPEKSQFPAVGIYLPSFAERYLYASNVMLFGRSYTYYGVERTCKSAYLFDRYRLFWQNAGRYTHLEAEDKDARPLRESILGYPPNLNDKKWSTRAETMDEWMKSYYKYNKEFKALSVKYGGRRFPMAFGIDSVMAKPCEATADKVVENDGVPQKLFADEAAKLKTWFPWAGSLCSEWPFVIMGINHDKPSPDQKNPRVTVHRSPGGYGPRFQSSYRVLFTPGEDVKRTEDGLEGQKVWLKMDKNSTGPTGRRIPAYLRWQHLPDGPDGQPRQKTWWDWQNSTVDVLYHEMEHGLAGDTRRKRLMSEVKLRRHKGDFWSCDFLNIDEDEKLGPSEMGARIDSDPALSALLDEIFEIQQYQVFQQGIDIRTQVGWPNMKD